MSTIKNNLTEATYLNTSNDVFNNTLDQKLALQLVPIKNPSISIFGLGYIGAVSAACFCDLGYKVIGVDTDAKKVKLISRGNSPIVEDQLPELLRNANDNDLLTATQDFVSAILATDITIVNVGTPSSSDGSCDTRYLQEASTQIGEAIKLKDSYHLVMYRSTVSPTTTREIMIPLLEHFSGKTCGKDFGVCFNPEFLRESTAIKDFYHPAKIVIGAFDERSGQYAASLYEGNVAGEIIHTSIEVAEFVKYVDNSWHALKVVFGNEIGRICKAMEVDSHEVMSIFCKDTKLNLSPYYMMPGFAYGGSCLPKDMRGINHLARIHGVDVPVLNHIGKSNDSHISHAEKLIEHFPGKRVGFLGVTFKAGTDDLRESPAVTLIQRLINKGYEVRLYDPNFKPRPLHESDHSQDNPCSIRQMLSGLSRITPDELLAESDMLVVTHADESFKTFLEKVSPIIPVIELVRLFENEKVDGKYHGICW